MQDRVKLQEGWLHTDWRVGRHRKRNVYAVMRGDPDDDVEVGRMESDELAEYVVQVHNMAVLRAESGEWTGPLSGAPIQQCPRTDIHRPHKWQAGIQGVITTEVGCPGRFTDAPQA